MRPLSNRLKAIFDLIEVGAKVADIGTDHAYLPIALSLSGKSTNIIACDINEKPLKKAQENIKKLNAFNIETRLSNGLMKINFGEADTVVIAGMGGDVISGILNECSWVKNKDITLLLQPMSSAEILREFLLNNCFEIISETPVIDEGKIYTIIKSGFSGIRNSCEDGFLYVGKVTADSQAGKAYIEKQYQRIAMIINDLEKLDNKDELVFKYKKIKEYINSLLEI